MDFLKNQLKIFKAISQQMLIVVAAELKHHWKSNHRRLKIKTLHFYCTKNYSRQISGKLIWTLF